MKDLILQGYFGWENIKRAFTEWLLTFSTRPSLISSKKLTTFVFGNTGAGLIVYAAITNVDKYTATDYTILVTPLFIYGGYIVGKSEKAKQTTPKAVPVTPTDVTSSKTNNDEQPTEPIPGQ